MTKKLLFVKELLLRGMNSRLVAVVLNSIMDSVGILTVLTFSVTAFFTLTVSWLFSVISFGFLYELMYVLWCYDMGVHITSCCGENLFKNSLIE
jgi:hypothetical protein